MVMTSVMEESRGKFPPLLDHSVEANPKEKKMKREKGREEKMRKEKMERNEK